MGEMISSFRDLRVYKMAFELQQELFLASREFPQAERYSLTDQVRRSSRSIGANIAEAWQKRRYSAHFVSKLTDADGEQAETQHWITTAVACHYLSEDKCQAMMEKCLRIGQMLGAMMAHPEKFRPPSPALRPQSSALGPPSPALSPRPSVLSPRPSAPGPRPSVLRPQ